MSTLREIIKENRKMKKELVASTIRMPREMHSFIDELAEQLSLSKQEVMLKLLEEGISIAKDELDSDANTNEISSKFHILNTNKGNSIEDHEKMLNDGIAAAFYEPWKYNIDRIQSGDIIFLYENGVGIVAFGHGSGDVLKTDANGDIDQCHYQHLSNFKRLEQPLSAKMVKKVLGRNVVFLRTMSSMPDGQKILDEINKM